MLWVFLQVMLCENVVDNRNTVYENPSSAGVGTKVDLKFDPDTLRIEDLKKVMKMQ